MRQRNGFELLARFGYAARGVVYLLVAGLALFTTFGGEEASSEGALTTLLGQPFGRAMLGAVAIGLVGHAAWRLAQSLLNADHREGNIKGYASRAGQFISALAHGALAFSAARLALGAGRSSASGQSEEGFVATILGLPFGTFLVGAIGLGVIVAGFGQVLFGVGGGYRKWLNLPKDQEGLLQPICVYALAARGIIFVILGGFLVYAAVTVNAERAGSLPEALDWVRSLPFGGILYAVVGIGLLAFALYCGVLALYRRVDAPSAREMKAAVT